MKLGLAEIKTLVERLAEKINSPQQLLPIYGHSIDGAHPHVEVDTTGMLYYVIVERGQELKRNVAVDIDDLLYWIFADITFSMAVEFELKHRIEREDCRRQIFKQQEYLLGALSVKWQQSNIEKHQSILKSHPFDDLASVRATYSKQLRDNGMPGMEAWADACGKYPLPKPI
jgi:hypothetical protein